MSHKLLIDWLLASLLYFAPLFTIAQTESSTISDYYLFHKKNQNFSLQAWLPSNYISLFFQNQFLINELCTVNISGNYNIRGNTVAFSMAHFGYSKYGILTISSGYARKWAKVVSFGLQVHYLMNHAGNYPKKHSLTFDLSLYGQITTKMGLGISAYNPANLKYGLTGKEKIPMIYTLMLNYKINDKVLLALTASKQLPGFFDIVGTVCFKDKFYGFITDISMKKVGVGFSFWWKRFQFDVGGDFDYRLGFSPFVGVSYGFKSTQMTPIKQD